MNRIALVFPGELPVPPVKGGAVENLVYNILKVNENRKKLECTVYSLYDEDAAEDARCFFHTKFEFFKVPSLIRFIDRLIYILVGVTKKTNIHSYRYIAHRLFYLYKTAQSLHIRNDIDLVILENHVTTCFVMKLFGNDKKYDGKFIYHAHNEVLGWFGVKKYFYKIKKYICVSKYIKRTIEEKGIKDCDVMVLKNVVDTEIFQKWISEDEKRKLKQHYGVKLEEKIVLFAGRLVEEKGVLEAILGVKKTARKNVKLMIVGKPFFSQDVTNEYEKKLSALIEDLGDAVIFTGYVPYSEMPKLYQISDIGLFPSIWEEPALLTGIEARCSGLPVITTDAGGIPEYVHDDFGITLKRNSSLVDNIAKSICMLLDDDKKRNEMRNKAIEYSKQFTAETYYEDFCNKIVF